MDHHTNARGLALQERPDTRPAPPATTGERADRAERDERPWAHPEGPGQGGRIRAARAAADLNREQLAAAIGSSARTVRRLEDEQRRVSTVELRRIAAACHVPEWFLLHGWRGWERLPDR